MQRGAFACGMTTNTPVFPQVVAMRCKECHRGFFYDNPTQGTFWKCEHHPDADCESRVFHVVDEWQDLERWLSGATREDRLILRRTRLYLFEQNDYSGIAVLRKTSVDEDASRGPSPPPPAPGPGPGGDGQFPWRANVVN